MPRFLAAGFCWWSLAVVAVYGAEQTPVVVAAYNVANYLPMKREEADPQPKPENEIQAVVAVVAGVRPDVLLVVEIGKKPFLEDLQSRLFRTGWEMPHAEWVRGADPERHLALLSRFPIVSRDSVDEVPFDLGGAPRLVGRGFLDVTIDAGWLGRVRLMGAHLKSRRAVPEYDEAQFRAREADLLRERASRALLADPALSLVVLGDFNDVKNSAPIRRLIGSRGAPDFLADIWLKDSRGETWTHYWKAADVYSRIDYILVSPALAPFVDQARSGIADPPGWNVGSDHRLVYATFRPTP